MSWEVFLSPAWQRLQESFCPRSYASGGSRTRTKAIRSFSPFIPAAWDPWTCLVESSLPVIRQPANLFGDLIYKEFHRAPPKTHVRTLETSTDIFELLLPGWIDLTEAWSPDQEPSCKTMGRSLSPLALCVKDSVYPTTHKPYFVKRDRVMRTDPTGKNKSLALKCTPTQLLHEKQRIFKLINIKKQ